METDDLIWIILAKFVLLSMNLVEKWIGYKGITHLVPNAPGHIKHYIDIAINTVAFVLSILYFVSKNNF